RVRLRDEPNTSHPLRQSQKGPRKGLFLWLAERACGRTHSGSTDSTGSNLDSRMAGPERAARRVRLRDEPNTSHPLRQSQKGPGKGLFLWLAERVCGRTHPGSTDSTGSNLDSRMAGPERAARRVRLRDEPNTSHPLRQSQKGPRKEWH